MLFIYKREPNDSNRGMETSIPKRSSEKERKGNALALGADEGRGKLRKATGSRKQASIRGCPNGETHAE